VNGLTEWARDVLLSRGALVEMEHGERLRTLLPAEVAGSLGAGEWLSLNFDGNAGSDEPTEWMERLAHLLPAERLVAGARLRRAAVIPSIDVGSVLASELVVQNGIYRLLDDFANSAQYLLFTFEYTVESDERSAGVVKVCINATARSRPPQTQLFWNALQGEIEDDPEFQAPADALVQLFPVAARCAQSEVRQLITPLEETAARHLARDSGRVESYYEGLLRQIEKRIARKSGDAEAVEKERSRARATRLDRDAKLEDLARKYSLRVEVRLADVLTVQLPVREISVHLIRKKEKRAHTLHWNAALKRLEPPLCENCGRAAQPLFLCEKVHCLCSGCWSACPDCRRSFCRVCQIRCKCGAPSA
jgi:hypothetical protein